LVDSEAVKYYQFKRIFTQDKIETLRNEKARGLYYSQTICNNNKKRAFIGAIVIGSAWVSHEHEPQF
jgi:hypothetical protein